MQRTDILNAIRSILAALCRKKVPGAGAIAEFQMSMI